jgi:epoxyqueuosine reductase QueG
MNEDKIIKVCDACLRACCWYGEFMCDKSKTAGTTNIKVKDLKRLDLENEYYWSDEKMEAIYGEKDPFVF